MASFDPILLEFIGFGFLQVSDSLESWKPSLSFSFSFLVISILGMKNERFITRPLHY